MKKNKKKKKLFLAVVVIIAFVFSWSFVLAQYANQEKIPTPSGSGQTTDFPTYLKMIIDFGFATIGILALFMIVIGAYQYLMAAGNIGKVDSAKETIGSALLGLILGLCAWIILYKINPDLVRMDLSRISGLGSGALTTGLIRLPSVTLSGNWEKMTDQWKDNEVLKKYAEKHGVPMSYALALMMSESTGNQAQISPKGAIGLYQLMPGTAQWLGYSPSEVQNNYETNIDAGLKYYSQIKNSKGVSWEDAAGFYNCGPNANWCDYKESTAHVAKVTEYNKVIIQKYPNL